MTAVLDWADTQKIGFSHFISLGNKCDVDEVDFVEEISEDPDTSILILYLESVTNGDKFFNIVSKATKRKPVVILKSGISPAGKVAASSHTGALAGDDIAFDIAFKRCGVIRAKTMKELFDLSNLFDKVSIPRGDRFAILTNAGGPGIIATDAFEQYNVEFSHFTETTIKTLKESLPPEASIKNPVDIVGDARPKRFEMALDAIFQESTDICAGALVLVTPQSTTDPTAVADVLVGIHKKYPDRLMLTTFIGGDTMQIPRRIVESHNIPSYSFPEPAIHSLRSLIDYKHYLDEENSDNEKRFLDVIRKSIETCENKKLYIIWAQSRSALLKSMQKYSEEIPSDIANCLMKTLQIFTENKFLKNNESSEALAWNQAVVVSLQTLNNMNQNLFQLCFDKSSDSVLTIISAYSSEVRKQVSTAMQRKLL